MLGVGRPALTTLKRRGAPLTLDLLKQALRRLWALRGAAGCPYGQGGSTGTPSPPTKESKEGRTRPSAGAYWRSAVRGGGIAGRESELGGGL